MAKYLLLKHYRSSHPTTASGDVAPMDQWTPQEVDDHIAFMGHVADILRERGEFVEPDPVVVKGLLGMHNYSYLWLREGGRLTPEEVGDRFCDVILAGLES